MKALTLTQPWATLVMLGEKRVETRPVLYSHRGPLAIHASRQLDGDAWHSPVFRAAFARHGIERAEQLPLGCVLGTVEVIEACRFSDYEWPHPLPYSWWAARIGVDEQHFGNFTFGRCGLLLANPQPFADAVPARGMNGLWNWEPTR